MTFEEYMRLRERALLRFAAVLTGDTRLAEEVLQEVLGRAFAAWQRIGAVDDPHAYVRRMVVNEYLSWRRKWGRNVLVADLEGLLPNAPDHATGHAERVELLSQLTRLPRAQRAAIVLRYYEGLADDEIAAATGTGTSAVRSNIARGLRTLRVHIVDGSERALPVAERDYP
ncbi:MAG TPA: SigE family RNA polymerase sigma factor [Jatrophihabitantaceae bacterium]|jgi:RNA polymerase sigma-70 factor (sigma-E family)|nr:SigE family RNA polymerase sigma factor [Jatrophihabitantaceae bacterium]